MSRCISWTWNLEDLQGFVVTVWHIVNIYLYIIVWRSVCSTKGNGTLLNKVDMSRVFNDNMKQNTVLKWIEYHYFTKRTRINFEYLNSTAKLLSLVNRQRWKTIHKLLLAKFLGAYIMVHILLWSAHFNRGILFLRGLTAR